MLTQLVIHILPEEIDWFEWQSKQLKQGSYYLDNDDKVLVDVTLNLNLIEWEESKLPKKYFVEKFKNIQKLYDWADTNFIADDNNICLGCNDKRRSSINESTSDNIVYLDADIIFVALFHIFQVQNVNFWHLRTSFDFKSLFSWILFGHLFLSIINFDIHLILNLLSSLLNI